MVSKQVIQAILKGISSRWSAVFAEPIMGQFSFKVLRILVHIY